MKESVQSIERAFCLLQELARNPGGVSSLARQVRLPTSTVARLLGTLEGLDAVEREADGVSYRLGSTISALASRVDPVRSILTVAQPQMLELVDQVGEAVGLAIPVGDAVKYIGQIDCSNPVQVSDWTGTSLPMHVVPSGLVVLANWPEAVVKKILIPPLERFTDSTIVDLDEVLERLKSIRVMGHAWVFEEFLEDINSVAAPLFDCTFGVVGALHSHCPAYRFPGDNLGKTISQQVIDTAAVISRNLGYIS